MELCLLSYQATSFSILELLHPRKTSRENKLVILANMDMAYFSGGNSGNATDTGIPSTKSLVNLTKSSRVHPVKAVNAALSSRKSCLAVECLQNSPTPSAAVAKH